MELENDYKGYKVLYVDDEEQALKYFRKAFDKIFDVVTATSAEEGWRIVQELEGKIAILVTDQRMPGMSGVELLSRVWKQYPKPIRMLTTAYSDLDSAIGAVNEGAIYQYIVKPWDLRELRTIFKRAIEFYVLQDERDTLLRERLSVLQRLVITDRVQSLAILAGGLTHRIQNSLQALSNFLENIPQRLEKDLNEAALAQGQNYWVDLSSFAQQESRSVIDLVEKITRATSPPEYHYRDGVVIAEVVQHAIENFGKGHPQAEIRSELPPDLLVMKADPALLQRCLESLFFAASHLSPENFPILLKVDKVDSVWETPGLSISIKVEGALWDENQLAQLFTVLSKDVDVDTSLNTLTAFFIVHHHAGDVALHTNPPDGPGFEVRLPLQLDQAQRPALTEGHLDNLFSHFSAWDAAIH